MKNNQFTAYKNNIFRYKINKDGLPMIIASYTNPNNITVYFPTRNYYKKSTIHNFNLGRIYPYPSPKGGAKGYNKYNIQDSFVQIFYYTFKHQLKAWTLVDKHDFDKIKDYLWSPTHQGYFHCCELRVMLHNYILPHSKIYDVDHKNRIRWDNRRDNLEIVVRSDNHLNKNVQSNNTSGLVGVSYDKRFSQWQARLKYKDIYFNEHFDTKLEASIYRRRLELEYSRYFLRPELEEYLLANITDENLLKELELI